MKNNIDDINGWLYHRIRMCIWKQWKKPRTKMRNLMKMISLFRTEDGIKMNIFDLSKDVYYMEIIGKKYILHLIY